MNNNIMKIMSVIVVILSITINMILMSCNRQSSEQENVAHEKNLQPEHEERLPAVDNGEWVILDYGKQIGNYRNKMGEIYWGNFYPDEYNYYYPPFKGVDIESFMVCKDSPDYAKDKNRVYYPVDIYCIDGTRYGGSYALKYILKGADSKTFKYIGNRYAVDSMHMYYDGFEIPWDNEVIRSKGLCTSADNLNLVDTVEVPVERGRND